MAKAPKAPPGAQSSQARPTVKLSARTPAGQAPVGAGEAVAAALLSPEVIQQVVSSLASLVTGPSGAAAAKGLAAAALAPVAASLIRNVGPAVTSNMLNTRVTAAAPSAYGNLRPLPLEIRPTMDPRLQLAVANRRSGKRSVALASTSHNEVAVIARVASLDDWAALPDVLVGSTLGQADDRSWIVTGRIALDRVEHVHAETAVLSLKASQPVRPTLAGTIAAMQVGPDALPKGTDPKGGTGVVVGIVDFGCDFAHKNFRRKDGTTRLTALWHQAGVASPQSPLGYGKAYSGTNIDTALAAPNPYASLGYAPDPDTLTEIGTHGTHVMDIAAGNGEGSGQPGVAPEAELIFVDAAMSDIAWEGPATVNTFFGDSVQLLEAVRFIFDRAGKRPCVVNVSLGTNGGPHDGTSLVEQGLDAVVREQPNRAIVIAAGNSQSDGIHTSGTVPGDAPHDIVWQKLNDGGGEMEIWYPGARRLEVTLVADDGTTLGPVAPGANLPVGANGQVMIFISNRLDDPNNHDNVIGIWLAENLSKESWTVRLRSLDEETVDYHAWIERNDAAQSAFAAAVPTHALGSISTGHETVVVGSYDGHKANCPMSTFSSAGPTRDGRDKPEISAPGQFVWAARSRTTNGVIRKSGTSMAAPAVAGLIALIFAEAQRTGVDLDIATVRRKLTSTVRTNPPGGGWDSQYGVGRACSAAI